MQKLAKNICQICYHDISLLLAYQVKFRSDPKCILRQKFYFQKTVIFHTLFTLMTPLKFKVILDIKFKCLIHKCDTGHRKNG